MSAKVDICKYGHTSERKRLGCVQCNRERAKAWYWNNKPQALARRSAYRAAHPEQYREYGAKFRSLFPERKKASSTKWQENNPIKRAASEQRRRARKRQVGGQFTECDVVRLLIAQSGRCEWCNACLDEKFHIDHIVPISRGGGNDAANICLSCPSCNIKKGAKLPSEFIGNAQGGYFG